MNEAAEEIDVEQTLEQLGKLSEEAGRDKKRFDAMLRKGSLGNPTTLANELVQTVIPTMNDAIELTEQLLVAQQESVFGLEDAVYQQNQRGVAALLDLLCKKNVISSSESSTVLAMFVSQDVDSVLSASDSQMILVELESFREFIGETEPQRERLDAAIARVKEITVSDDGDDAADDGAEETIEASGTAVEATN